MFNYLALRDSYLGIEMLELLLNIQIIILNSENYGWEICNYWQDQG